MIRRPLQALKTTDKVRSRYPPNSSESEKLNLFFNLDTFIPTWAPWFTSNQATWNREITGKIHNFQGTVLARSFPSKIQSLYFLSITQITCSIWLGPSQTMETRIGSRIYAVRGQMAPSSEKYLPVIKVITDSEWARNETDPKHNFQIYHGGREILF